MENEVRRFLFEDYLSSPASYRPGAFEDFEEVSDMKTIRRNVHREWMESEFDLLREIMQDSVPLNAYEDRIATLKKEAEYFQDTTGTTESGFMIRHTFMIYDAEQDMFRHCEGEFLFNSDLELIESTVAEQWDTDEYDPEQG